MTGMVEILKQGQYQPMSLAHQVAILYVAGQGHLDELPVAQVKPFEEAFHTFLDERYPDVIHQITRTNELADPIAKQLDEAAVQCKQQLLTASRAQAGTTT